MMSVARTFGYLVRCRRSTWPSSSFAGGGRNGGTGGDERSVRNDCGIGLGFTISRALFGPALEKRGWGRPP
jgi:hypothetical protein